jgi:predicted Zn-ribbon and HTH transcriptional regulator
MGAAGEPAVHLLSRLLSFEPRHRASAGEALSHEYFFEADPGRAGGRQPARPGAAALRIPKFVANECTDTSDLRVLLDMIQRSSGSVRLCHPAGCRPHCGGVECGSGMWSSGTRCRRCKSPKCHLSEFWMLALFGDCLNSVLDVDDACQISTITAYQLCRIRSKPLQSQTAETDA